MDRLIVAKQIESLGGTVPDDFNFFSYGNDANYGYNENPIELIQDFIEKGRIGKFKEYDDFKEYQFTYSIRFNCLEELYRYKLSETHKTELINIIQAYIPSEESCFDTFYFDGKSHISGLYLYTCFYVMDGFIFEVTDTLMKFTKKVKELIEKVKLEQKGKYK
ncbi:hypothetical protein [Viridibacillus arvi]|uniref:hypothetical protein n=1 Tax=Viridibacillus arvi TaxID=263475 RepID=UPI0034CF1CB8